MIKVVYDIKLEDFEVDIVYELLVEEYKKCKDDDDKKMVMSIIDKVMGSGFGVMKV